MKKRIKVLGVLALGLLVLAGCGKGDDQEKATASSTSSQSETTVITVKDSEGEVEVPVNPEKVVVFDMGSLDTINSLGKGETVIGTATDNLPAYLDQFADVESAGGIKEPDLEKINELQPDLIIISGRQSEFKKDLSAIAPTLYLAVDNADTWNSTKTNIETLASIFNEEDLAKEKIADLETQIAETKEKAQASKLTTLVTLVNEGQLSAYGEGSRFGIIHDTFGFIPADTEIEVSTHGQSASFEYVLEKNPDVIFVIDRTKAIGGDDENNDVSKNELVAQTNAGKNDKIISLQADVWYLSGGGIECTELMLKDVEAALK
ncbi:siderophore ABC transporter substrate-binding protein [Vagococcus sp. BWB3-3]|uniref:Siderophore ABC transporter substrate-binding protein n=1 Tax=Vagococcus allomyrinae TaxID=2794353 RepID=A0A940PAR1_9ENTE|nr:siderophore ABC transporter substrate-binding protein [Vagococcus allomyrinae]MBP1039981.1 siderophore ABC transporter substrate-binding protein [Vagococcus allomyrinae]